MSWFSIDEWGPTEPRAMDAQVNEALSAWVEAGCPWPEPYAIDDEGLIRPYSEVHPEDEP